MAGGGKTADRAVDIHADSEPCSVGRQFLDHAQHRAQNLEVDAVPFEVTEAAEGFAALKLARESEFDIVLLDYNMPGFSGLETLAEFKREKRRMTVVVITSAQDNSLAARVRAEGAAFLRKPFFPADIETALIEHYGLTALSPLRV